LDRVTFQQPFVLDCFAKWNDSLAFIVVVVVVVVVEERASVSSPPHCASHGHLTVATVDDAVAGTCH